MIGVGTKDCSPAYSSWFEKSVVMLVVIRQFWVPIPCRILGESSTHVHARILPGWEVDIRKNLILALGEVVIAMQERVN